MSAVLDVVNNAKWPEWDEPQPLIRSEPNKKYPVDALPTTIRLAVTEVQAYVQSPVALVAQSALSAASIAVQAHYDVERDSSLSGPCGLFMLAVGDSGERKTSGDGYFLQAIEMHEQNELERIKPEQQKFSADHDSWQTKRSALLATLKSLTKSGKSTLKVENQIQDLQKEEPQPPGYQRILFSDATPEALTHRMATVFPSGAVCSDEAGSVLGSHGMSAESQMRNLATLCGLWGGQTHTVDRRASSSYVLKNPRLTVALQVQEPTLLRFMKSTGQLARGSGFFARFLLAKPESTQGQRPYVPPPAKWNCLEVLNSRVTELLDREVARENGVLQPTKMPLSIKANAKWIEYHDLVEAELGDEGEFRELRDSASKIAENAARLAAIFEVIENPFSIEISEEMMERGISVATWHVYEAKRFFNEISLPENIRLAQMLDEWLLKYCTKNRVSSLPKRDIQRFAPRQLRSKEPLEKALAELEEAFRVRWSDASGKQLISVNPNLLQAVG